MLAILEDLLRLDRDWTGSDGAIVEAYQALGPAGHGALSGGLYNEFRLVPPRERKALAVGSPAEKRSAADGIADRPILWLETWYNYRRNEERPEAPSVGGWAKRDR